MSVYYLLIFSSAQHHGAYHSAQEEHAADLERQHIFIEKHFAQVLHQAYIATCFHYAGIIDGGRFQGGYEYQEQGAPA